MQLVNIPWGGTVRAEQIQSVEKKRRVDGCTDISYRVVVTIVTDTNELHHLRSPWEPEYEFRRLRWLSRIQRDWKAAA